MIVVLRPATRQLVDQAFANRADTSEELAGFEFPLRGTTTVAELEDMYGIVMDTTRELTLDKAIRQRLGRSLASGGNLGRLVSVYGELLPTVNRAGWDDNSSRTERRHLGNDSNPSNS